MQFVGFSLIGIGKLEKWTEQEIRQIARKK
jgi:hypothetical protein